jgi:hypothetical protein
MSSISSCDLSRYFRILNPSQYVPPLFRCPLGSGQGRSWSWQFPYQKLGKFLGSTIQLLSQFAVYEVCARLPEASATVPDAMSIPSMRFVSSRQASGKSELSLSTCNSSLEHSTCLASQLYRSRRDCGRSDSLSGAAVTPQSPSYSHHHPPFPISDCESAPIGSRRFQV